ncbi:MAG: low molecular weight phosphotyrosine protein phosphatase [Limnohabitans sp.]|nr:MAG: low molecular weight phosphotyrosine protein phosphatase [Limnohabitans sp.]
MLRILFVCMGNICRSPTAHGVMQHKLQLARLAHRVEVESAGTHAYHVGEAPDRRSQQHARLRGYDLSPQRAQAVQDTDFARFDKILAMDADNLQRLRERCPAAHQHKLGLLTDHCQRHPHANAVPDPYYGGSAGFEHVLDLVEDACEQLILEIQNTTP